MYIEHIFPVLHCLCALFKDLHIDYTFKDESIECQQTLVIHSIFENLANRSLTRLSLQLLHQK